MNIFQKIINREIPSDILYEDEKYIAFYDIKPKRKGHFLVVPKKHSTNLLDIDESSLRELFSLARKLALKEINKLKVSGFSLEVNNGENAGQEIFHTHVHVIPTLK